MVFFLFENNDVVAWMQQADIQPERSACILLRLPQTLQGGGGWGGRDNQRKRTPSIGRCIRVIAVAGGQ